MPVRLRPQEPTILLRRSYSNSEHPAINRLLRYTSGRGLSPTAANCCTV